MAPERTHDPEHLTRREALKRTGLLLGGTLALSFADGAVYVARAAAPGWTPRVLSAAQLEMVAVIADHIIPPTDTPGARAAGVHRLVDTLLADHYGAAERDRFVAGLRAANVRAIRTYGVPFLRCSAAQQLDFVTALDAEAYPATAAARPGTPRMRDSLSTTGLTTGTPATAPAARPASAIAADAGEPRAGAFFRRMKELTLFGYYTSRIGATQELGLSPYGPFHGDIPYGRIGHGWA